MLRSRFVVWCVLGVLASPLSPALAAHDDDSIRTAEAVRIDGAPTLDGILSEDVWEIAAPLSDFVQADPLEGQPASEKTEVRILYNEDALFFGVVCYDTEPSQLVVTDSRRDANLAEMDSFFIILDTYHDYQNGFVFATNPAGLEYDGHVTNQGEGGQQGGSRQQTGSGAGFNKNWDASWRVRTQIGDYGWSAEFAIPLRTLRYPSGKPQTWGVNFQRNIRRKREEVYWSPIARAFNLYRLSSAGELRNLSLETPRNFKVTPYVLGSAQRDFVAATETDLDGDWGVDAKLGLSPAMNLDLTYNTDFAQVEVDEQQINLTRFNLFFPEKRPFFLENAGLFKVGSSGDVEIFFSRRIGIAEDGSEVSIVGGARLSGKAHGFNVGFLNMQTEEVSSITAANNFTVARLSREIGSRSSLGAVFVNRLATGSAAGEDNWNRTWGVDGKLGIGEYWTFDGYAARTETPGRAGIERALNGRAEYKRTNFRSSVQYREVGEDFNPEVGFLERSNYRSVEANIFTNVLTKKYSWLRELRPHTSWRNFWDFEGFKESSNWHIDSHIDFENGWFFSPAVNLTLEGLKAPFEIFPGLVVAPGTYKNAELAWRFNTDQRKWLAFNFDLDYGGFLSGDKRTYGPTVTIRSGAKLTTSLRYTLNDVDLVEGSFTTNLAQWRVSYAFTPFIYLQSLIQYNDRVDNWAVNLRFSWLNTAGTGLFIVYNETQALEGLGRIDRSFVVKYTKQFDILK